jgi:uncharacterized membrane protein
MGFLDFLSGGNSGDAGQPAPSGGKAFKLSYEFSPLRLKARKDSKVAMMVTVVNTSNNKQLASVDLEIAGGNKVGFDVTSMKRHHEERLGELAPGASKSFSVNLHGSPLTKAGEVPIKLTAYSHYLNYKKVLEQSSKSARLRVI